MTARPLVSVLVPAYHSFQTLPTFLESLRTQTFRDFEVIVVDSSPDDAPLAGIRARFPDACIRHNPTRLLPHEARNVAAQAARGDILVFTDPDCSAAPDWLARLVECHRAGHEAVGGAVAHETGWWNAAVHFAKYAWWLPGGGPAERSEIPTANASFSRRIWERAGPFHGNRFAGDSLISWRVRAQGCPIWFDPRAVVTHMDHVRCRAFVLERWRRGIDFGASRGAALGWRRRDYLLRFIAAPIGPLVMTARAARYAAAAGKLGPWVATLPVQALGNGLWCAGEAVAHLRAGASSQICDHDAHDDAGPFA